MATLKDIAEAAGISIGTVDRIIHKRGRYSEETAEKVRRIIDELNYSPNIHARGLKKTRNYSFAAVIPEEYQDSNYWKLVADGVKRASNELSPFCSRVKIYHFDRYSSESCLKALSSALKSGCDGILIAPVIPGAVQDMLEEAEVPFLFIDTDIPDEKKRVVYIGQDSYRGGVLSGKLMSMMINCRKLHDTDYLLIIEPPGSNYHLKSRIEGFRFYIEQNCPSLRIGQVKTDTDDESRFHAEIAAVLNKTDNPPCGIYSANSSVYYLASYLEKLGGSFVDIPVIGYDLIPGKERFVETEVINFILTQQPEEQAYMGIMMLYDVLVLNKKAESEVIIPLNIITKENLHTFRKENSDTEANK